MKISVFQFLLRNAFSVTHDPKNNRGIYGDLEGNQDPKPNATDGYCVELILPAPRIVALKQNTAPLKSAEILVVKRIKLVLLHSDKAAGSDTLAGLGEISILWCHFLNARLKPESLSTALWVELGIFDAQPGGLIQNVLSIRDEIKDTSLVRQLAILKVYDWINLWSEPDDLRANRVFLMDKARQALETISSVGRELWQELKQGLGIAEICARLQILASLKARLQPLYGDDRAFLHLTTAE